MQNIHDLNPIQDRGDGGGGGVAKRPPPLPVLPL